MNCFDLSGKMAVVTGGARGIGKSIALLLAQNGADVFIGDMLEEESQKTQKELEALGVKAGYRIVDVSKKDQLEQLFDDAIAASRSGQMDILVHNAAIVVTGSVFDATPEETKRITSVNVLGMFYAMTEGIKKMMGNRGGGKVVLISSVAGRHGFRVQGHYNATKAAGINFAQSCAVEAAQYGINVNTICPGIIRTQMWDRILEKAERDLGISQEEEWETYMEEIPQKRAQTPEEIANVALFFCSDLSSAVTGQALNVDGGRYLN